MDEEAVKEERSKVSRLTESALEWAGEIVFAVVLISVLFTFFFRIITVDGRSMEPTYFDGNRVLVTGLAGKAKPGDVVIVVHALQEPIIKRVIAVEGQTVDFDPVLREVTVDSVPIKGEEYGIENSITMIPDYPGQVMEFPQTVPKGCVFLLGDNRGNSKDSRFLEVGMVDNRNILGKVIFNVYPFSIFGPAA